MPRSGARVTLHRVLVHMIAETHRHAGHADIVRELVDGTVGMRRAGDDMVEGDAAWWADYPGPARAAGRGLRGTGSAPRCVRRYERTFRRPSGR
ncbi:mycothiol transferase [Pseudonocardia sp. DLS-67]